MTDIELVRKYELLKSKLLNIWAKEAELAEIIDELHEVRVELWRRGVHAPDATSKARYEATLEKRLAVLTAAEQNGNKLCDIYMKRDVVRDLQDRIKWIENH